MALSAHPRPPAPQHGHVHLHLLRPLQESVGEPKDLLPLSNTQVVKEGQPLRAPGQDVHLPPAVLRHGHYLVLRAHRLRLQLRPLHCDGHRQPVPGGVHPSPPVPLQGVWVFLIFVCKRNVWTVVGGSSTRLYSSVVRQLTPTRGLSRRASSALSTGPPPYTPPHQWASLLTP